MASLTGDESIAVPVGAIVTTNDPGARSRSGRLFISYRRGETSGQARALHDRLAQHFGAERVYMDVDSIALGADFVQNIEQALDSSPAVLVLIGHDWMQAAGDEHPFDNPNDFIRLEVGTALRLGVRTIPILIERTPMPAPEDLPEELRPLTRRHALELENGRWEYDVSRLVKALEPLLGPTAPEPTFGLGAHRLKDLSRSEQVSQLNVPELASTLPPLRSLDNPDDSAETILPTNQPGPPPRPSNQAIGRGRRRRSRTIAVVVLTVVVVGGGVTAIMLLAPSHAKPSPTHIFADGTWIPGKTIAAGTYHTKGGADCSWQRDRDLSGTHRVIATDLPSGPSIVTIAPSDAAFKTHGCGTWTTLPATGPQATSFGDGTYAVGIDIAPGTYSAPGGSSCYWERDRDFSGTDSGIIADDLPSRPSIVTIAPSDKAFKTDGCGAWTAPAVNVPSIVGGSMCELGTGPTTSLINLGIFTSAGVNEMWHASISSPTGQQITGSGQITSGRGTISFTISQFGTYGNLLIYDLSGQVVGLGPLGTLFPYTVAYDNQPCANAGATAPSPTAASASPVPQASTESTTTTTTTKSTPP